MSKRILFPISLAMLTTMMAGCAVGPDYRKPPAPAAQQYIPGPLNAYAAASGGPAVQGFAEGADVPARWWTLFGSDALDRLVDAAERASPDVQSAEAALRVGRENAAATRGAYLPSVEAHYTPTRQKISDPLASPLASNADLYTLHTAQLNIAYVAGVFGGTRRQSEVSTAQFEQARFQNEAARLTLASNVVAAAIQEAALRAQLDAMIELVALARKQLDVVRKQRQAGQSGASDIAAQETLLAQAEAGLPPLEKQLAQQHDLVAALTGHLPSDTVEAIKFDALTLPPELPVSLPARLIEQRPDIRAAEAQLHAASAQIGVAKAARLPDITLSATLGSSSLGLSTLFKSGTGAWSIGADLVQPIFKGGTLLHQQRAAEAGYDQAAAQYRGVVLTAFQNVADTLHAIVLDTKALEVSLAAEQAARQSLAIAQRQWQVGAVGHPAVLLADQAYRQTMISVVQARAARFADTVALFQALGGGWWNTSRQDPAANSALGQDTTHHAGR
ncbi:efflux transporter outer membrane subunit [Massilia sp. Root335]|uniref:efflux transporter outer membrane subunit n=1 Tax=Massilia sp. Root335 TaxID=1736517 RepID=UPI0006F5F939|nr:efflux transporter outer membrane subunit [Massilia sp. Root335]KQV45111.1 histidine kinase [Massilia sp. Root335]